MQTMPYIREIKTTAALPVVWRRLFWIEPPLVIGTALYWFLAPDKYLWDVLGIDPAVLGTTSLLHLYAAVTLSLAGLFYAWFLSSATVHVPTFRAFQAALWLGDVLIVAISLRALSLGAGNPSMLVVQAAMACVWGLLRAVYLWQSRRHSRDLS